MQSVRAHPRLLRLLLQHERNAVVAVNFSSKKNFRRSAHAQATTPPRDSLSEQLERYASFQPSPVTISNFISFGRTQNAESSFLFLRKEVPVRIANIWRELHLLPAELQETPGVRAIDQLYSQSFSEILTYVEKDSKDHEVQEAFMRDLRSIRSRHGDVVTVMAKAIYDLKVGYKGGRFPRQMANNIQYFLDRLYTSRISTRMLINQHTALYGANGNAGCNNTNGSNGKLPVVGNIDPHCDVIEVVTKAYNSASFLCEQHYLTAPELCLVSHDLTVSARKLTEEREAGGDRIECVYVPAHLYHILFELFKNAMRATIEHHGEDAVRHPPIKVLVVKSAENVTVKMSDLGGGIPMRLIRKVFRYLYTTAPNPIVTSSADDPSESKLDGGQAGVPLAGYGYGLPLSRLYARYLAGDLQLFSVDGLGTDAVLILQTLASEAKERLPIYNQDGAKKIYEAQSVSRDWTDPDEHH